MSFCHRFHCFDFSPVWQYRPTYHRSNLANNMRGEVSTIGIRNCNFWMSQVRKRGKIDLNQSLVYIHPFPCCHPKCTHSWLTNKLFLGRKNIERLEGANLVHPFTPPSYTYATYQWLDIPVVSPVLCLSTETVWHFVISVVDTEVHAACEILSLAFLILQHLSLCNYL